MWEKLTKIVYNILDISMYYKDRLIFFTAFSYFFADPIVNFYIIYKNIFGGYNICKNLLLKTNHLLASGLLH